MVKGVTQRIKLFFFSYPHSSAKQCCEMLGLDYKKYGSMCRNLKSKNKKLLNSNVQGRVLNPLKHREEMKLELPREVVDSLIFEASRRRPRKADPKPFDEWYVTPNRNRMMLLHNDYITMRVWPKSGTCRVLPGKPMPYEWLKVAVQNAFFKAGVDLRLCEKVADNIEAISRHRIFKVGPVTPFEIDHYKNPLGLTILADGSHPEFVEAIEEWPSWIKPFLSAVANNTEALNALRRELPREMDRIATEQGRIASSFEKSMQEHLDIIRDFREESIKRQQLIEKELTRKRRRKRKAKKKPKPKPLWKKLLRMK